MRALGAHFARSLKVIKKVKNYQIMHFTSNYFNFPPVFFTECTPASICLEPKLDLEVAQKIKLKEI